jgi:hypothetical protein
VCSLALPFLPCFSSLSLYRTRCQHYPGMYHCTITLIQSDRHTQSHTRTRAYHILF